MADDGRFRVEDERFSGSANAPLGGASQIPPRPSEPRSAARTCLMGCLFIFLAMVVIAVIGGIWISRHWKDWASGLASQALKQTIEGTDLPPQERDEINVQIDRAAEAFRDGKLDAGGLERLMTNLVDSPLLTMIAASAIDKKYIAASGLNDAEKAAAQVTLQRYLRGAMDHKFTQEQIDAAMRPVADQKGPGKWELRDRVTDDELRQFLKTANEQADAAGIPAEIDAVDPSDEFKRIVDEALNPRGAAPAADDNAEPIEEPAEPIDEPAR
jgi:hypothetical protein